MESNVHKQKRKSRHRKGKELSRILAFAFIGGILLLAIASIIKPDVRFSEEENRVLAEFPEFSKESIADKEYMTGLEAYTSDQFILRDMWIKMKVQCDLLLGKRELNGVYLGRSSTLCRYRQSRI